eukprot:CAMPEP_0172308298 /NCGR_PEP_ID=MMETSP1058-20130122/8936_1 /TAXON_ID=83371 /ORGANISM="Detonula confervacea, Strain CCMP 353" /LENGTH=475 /DNA_ID=CAMNT_0013020681 /DNA_START=44 /DNA_END=1471 /DNA_ORIENTATION=+
MPLMSTGNDLPTRSSLRVKRRREHEAALIAAAAEKNASESSDDASEDSEDEEADVIEVDNSAKESDSDDSAESESEDAAADATEDAAADATENASTNILPLPSLDPQAVSVSATTRDAAIRVAAACVADVAPAAAGLAVDPPAAAGLALAPPAAAGIALAPRVAVAAMPPHAAASAQEQEVGHAADLEERPPLEMEPDVFMRDILNLRVQSALGITGIVLGRYHYKYRGVSKAPILFVGGPSSPTGRNVFLALKLALSTVLYPASVPESDRRTQDDLMCSLIDSAGPAGIKLNAITRTNLDFGKHLLQMLSLFFLFNDFRPRFRLNVECDNAMMLSLRVNQGVLFEYFLSIFRNDSGQRCSKLFRHCVLSDCNQDVNKILYAIKYLGEKAKRGIWCDWASTRTHKNCMFVHHFMVMQTFHLDLMVTGMSSENQLMNGDYCFTFHGGTWSTFFTYDNTAGVVGSRISWRGTGGDDT